jgi:uncharacterized protein
MKRDLIGYQELHRRAMHGLIRDILKRLACLGIEQKEHRICVHFRTTAPGVEIPDQLSRRYPTTMMIALSGAFWDLDPDDEGFSVLLTFDTIPCRLRIPYRAISIFVDTGVEFGLQFAEAGPSAEDSPTPEPVAAGKTAGEEDAGRGGPGQAAPAAVDEAAKAAKEPAEEGNEAASADKIVTLDRFRKK